MRQRSNVYFSSLHRSQILLKENNLCNYIRVRATHWLIGGTWSARPLVIGCRIIASVKLRLPHRTALQSCGEAPAIKITYFREHRTNHRSVRPVVRTFDLYYLYSDFRYSVLLFFCCAPATGSPVFYHIHMFYLHIYLHNSSQNYASKQQHHQHQNLFSLMQQCSSQHHMRLQCDK